MNLKDGPGWSPDGGNYWVKGNLIYWEDGDIHDMNNGSLFRVMDREQGEDYSLWTDEKREAVKMEYKLERDKLRKKREIRDEEIRVLIKSARSKLTEEEINVCNFEEY